MCVLVSSGADNMGNLTCSGMADVLPAPAALLPQLQCVALSTCSMLEQEQEHGVRVLKALATCPGLHTLQLHILHHVCDMPGMLHAAKQLPHLRVLICNGSLDAGGIREHGHDMPGALPILGCQFVVLRCTQGPSPFRTVHTFTAPSLCMHTNAAACSGSSSNGGSSGRFSSTTTKPHAGQRQRHIPPLSLDVTTMHAFPAVYCMQGVEIELYRRHTQPSIAKQLLMLVLNQQAGQQAGD